LREEGEEGRKVKREGRKVGYVRKAR